MPRRLIWMHPEWSTSMAEIVPPLLRLRALYGNEVASLAEQYAIMGSYDRDGPTNQDRKHTVQKIIEDPGVAVLDGLDSQTTGALTLAAWRYFKRADLHQLTPDELVQCAEAAMLHLGARNGRPNKHFLAVQLTRALLEMRGRQMDRARREEFIEDVMKDTKLASAHRDTIRSLITKAGAGFLARSARLY